jgi:transcriptional regulator with XRE-family HTH domain
MIKEKLKTLRKQRGLTQKQLEEMTGIAQRNISSYESGKLQPSSKTLRRFAEAFGVAVDQLAGPATREPSLALPDPELLQMFQDITSLPEDDRSRLKWVISLALRQNKIQEMMAS